MCSSSNRVPYGEGPYGVPGFSLSALGNGGWVRLGYGKLS
jgi:hypothetical protein